MKITIDVIRGKARSFDNMAKALLTEEGPGEIYITYKAQADVMWELLAEIKGLSWREYLKARKEGTL